MAHTPIPWKTVRNSNGHFAFVSMNESWGPLAEMIMAHPAYTPELQEANATFIVRAVNNHAKLLAALEECYRVLSTGSYHAAPATIQARDAIEEDKK